MPGKLSSIMRIWVNTIPSSNTGTSTIIRFRNAVMSRSAEASSLRCRRLISPYSCLSWLYDAGSRSDRCIRVGHDIQQFHAGHFEAVDNFIGAGLQQGVEQQQRNGRDQAKGGGGHGYENPSRHQGGFRGGIGGGNGRKAADKAVVGASKAKSLAAIGKGGKVLGAFFSLGKTSIK